MKHLTILTVLLFVTFTSLFSQWREEAQYKIPGNIEIDQILMMKYDFTSTKKITGKSLLQYSAADMQTAIDSTWGPGLPTSEKIRIFDAFWNKVDSAFACFHDIPDNWLALKQQYRPEVAAGVSKGRFAGIMSVLSIALRDVHSKARDNGVFFQNPYDPVLYVGGWGTNRFGAGITIMPDSTLLVYGSNSDQPFGLQPGDIVLGYDGVLWKDLVRTILSYEFPILGIWGSSPSAFNHSLLIAAGINWHLFETIDIMKYGTNEIVHLPTSLMMGYNNPFYQDEQMVIPGVPKPNTAIGEYVSYGIVQGTNIGYIYGVQWSGNAGIQFFNAVNALKNTNGLIIDFRTNHGGDMYLSDSALKVLFSSTLKTIDFGQRTSPLNHLQLTAFNNSQYYKINGTPPGYLKPIALLTGPGAVSSGDQVALRIKYHPRVKIFGKPTNAAFSQPGILTVHTDWFTRFAIADVYEVNTPGRYISHLESPVDEHVWLTRDGVAQGRDDVVEAAKNWINLFSGTGTTLFTDNAEGGFGKWTTNKGWAVIKSNAHSPVNSFTDSKLKYVNNTDNSMTMINPVNTSGKDAVVLSFWHKYATQLDKDFCRVEVSSNNGSTWQEAVRYSGTVSSIHEARIDITKYANSSSNVKVRFRLTSDASTVADGWYVDDILITSYTSAGMSATNISGENNPVKYSLSQNYPNPFNPTTKINFDIPASSFTKLKIYDMLGKEVAVLVNNNLQAGKYIIEWNASNQPSGVYFYKLETENFSSIKKMILVK